MEILPIIIIVSLLGFFIILTLILFTWQYLRARERRRKHRSSESERYYKPTRKLTLQSGRAIPTSQKQDTASTRGPHSLDMTSPLPIFTAPTYTVTCEASTHGSPQRRPIISSQDHRHPPILEARSQKRDVERPRRVVSEPNRPKEKKVSPRVWSVPTHLTAEKDGSLTIPRPALVTIESRRPSATKSIESQTQRVSDPKATTQPRRSSASKGQEITDSLQKAYQGPLGLGGRVYDVPTSPVLWNGPIHSAESRGAGERRTSGGSLESPAVSSRVISDSIERPPPLFSGGSSSPRVRFAPPTKVDLNRVSFLSMTDSVSSSVALEQVSPISPLIPSMRAPPPSTVELTHYDLSPLSSSKASATRVRDTPPHLKTPDFGQISFFDSATSSSEEPSLPNRGVSVMSNRSNFTIASSEISSSNWTFGNAKMVNIYPSVAQEKERSTPPYARKLRSKYGQYPRGLRNKALPVVPKSPLSRSDFGPL